jgi:serine/threonine protein kinase
MTDDLIGKKIGGYEVLELIGRGGMASVYRAHQVSMNRVVAIKMLPSQYLNDDTYMQRFHREVKIVAQLEHRNIVPVHDYGEENEQPYIVMRYMAGGSIDDLLVDGALELDQIVKLLDQIAPALDYAHSKSVLHRDLKPSNVLMDDNGGAYLTDFGIARILGDPVSSITTQGVVGTPSYMSPEQAQGQTLDNRSDIYSLGVMLFEMATGRRPFESDTPYSIAVMHVTQPPPPPRSINSRIPLPVENVILTCLSKNRDSRYKDAVTLAEALRRAVNPPVVNLYDTQRGMARPDLSSPAELPPQPTPYVPPPPSSDIAYVPVGGTSGSLPPVQRQVRPKRKPNLIFSAALGGLLGCGLLTLVIVVLVLVASNILQQQVINEQDETATAQAGTDTTSTPTPRTTPDATSQGAVSTSVSETTPTLSASTGTLTDLLVYTAERNNNFDIYKLDVTTDRETRLTSSSLNDIYPAFSPDGERIVYISDSDGDYELWVMDADGRSQRRLTLNTVNDRYPAWSPDGEWIVYSSDVRGDGNFDLYRVPADGDGEPEELFSDGSRNSFPHWRGNVIVFTNGSNADARAWEIAQLTLLDGNEIDGEPEFLTDNDVKDWSPVVAPDGTIYYLTEGDGRSAIARLDPDSGNSRIIYDGEHYEWGITFTPDGRVIFASDESGRDELYVMTADGEELEQLTTNGAMSPSWASS